MSLDLLLEAALFVEQQQQISQPSPKGEEPKLLNGHHHNGYEHPHAASVIQRLPSSATNGSSQSCSPTPNGYSPKMMQDAVLVIPEQQQQTSSSNYRVDDVASRSHRLEEALLRASRNKSPIQQYPAGGSSSGRTSADEFSELKKRTGAGTREVHNKLEKNRRAHLRECFEFLRKQLPTVDDKKLSNLGILKSALRFIQTLKRKEREYEHTMERLAREKIAAQQRLASLRKEVSILPGYSGMIPAALDVELDGLEEQDEQYNNSLTLANVAAHTIRTTSNTTTNRTDYPRSMDNVDRESNSGTSTASERGDDYMSADENGGGGGDGPSAFPPESYSHATQQPVHVVRPVAQHASNGSRIQPAEEVLQRPVIQPPPSSYNIKYVRPIVSTSSTTTYLTVLPDGSSPGGGQLYQAFAATAQPPPSAAQQQTLKVLTQAGAQPGTTTSLRLVTAPDGVSTSLQSIVTTSGKMGEGEGFCIPAGVVIPSLVAIPASSGSESGSLPSSAAYDPSRNNTSSPHLIKSNSPTVLSLPNGVLKASRSLQTSSTTGVTHVMTPIAVTRSLPPGHVMTGMAVMGQPAHILTGSSLGKVGLQLKPGTFPIIGGQYVSTGTASGGVRAQLIKPMMVVSAAAPLPTSSSSIISVTTTSTSSSNPAGSNPGPKYHHHPPNC